MKGDKGGQVKYFLLVLYLAIERRSDRRLFC